MKKLIIQSFFVVIFCLFNDLATAQIINDTIRVNTTGVVEIVFPGEPNGKLPKGDGSFEVSEGKKKSLLLKATRRDSEAQPLLIEEGKRQHLFVLFYDENSPVKRIDYSSTKKLNQRVQEKKQAFEKSISEAHQLYANKMYDRALLYYQRLRHDVNESDQAAINELIEECRLRAREINDQRFKEVVALGDKAFGEKNFSEADSFFRLAITYNPNDEEMANRLNSNKTMWFKEAVAKADKADKQKNFIQAKTFYEEAKRVNPEEFEKTSAKTYARVETQANNQNFTQFSLKGDQAFDMKEWEEAIQSYESALLYKQDNAHCLAKIKKAREEIFKNENKRHDEMEYVRLLSKAKRLTAVASTAKDYEQVLADYRTASALFPSRKFPRDKIAEITKRLKTNPTAGNREQ